MGLSEWYSTMIINLHLIGAVKLTLLIKVLTLLRFIIVLVGVLLGLGLSLSSKNYFDREKIRPFECGFTPFSVSRSPFSLRFFLVAVIFLIFDVELILLFPIVLSISYNSVTVSRAVFSLFLVALFVGLFHELNEGSLDWANWLGGWKSNKL